MIQEPKRQRGSRNGNAALTEAQVRVIKAALRDTDVSYRELGKIYMVSSETIRRIDVGDTWQWITLELDIMKDLPVEATPVSTKTDADAEASLRKFLDKRA